MALKFKESVCSCDTCKNMCKMRPCWPTPQEADAIILAGYGARLMEDYWVSDDNIYIISPAIVGSEGESAPFWPKGRCTFLTKDDLCELHNKDLKPVEGRAASCKGDESFDTLHEDVAMLWGSSTGKSVVKKWRAIISQNNKELANTAANMA